SMGPRFANRGYRWQIPFVRSVWEVLQWVHGSRTVVIGPSRTIWRGFFTGFNGSTVREPWLSSAPKEEVERAGALQWVHGSRTVVIDYYRLRKKSCTLSLQLVHGSRTVVIASVTPSFLETFCLLQWVHGSRTVVIAATVKPEQTIPRGFNGSTVREP